MLRATLAALTMVSGAAALAGAAELPLAMAPDDLAAALRRGGLVLYMRHPETDRAQADAEALDLADCATQRNLTEAGRRTAAAVGAALRSVGAAFDRAVTSEYCRARDTAALMALPTATEASGALNDGGRMQASGPDSPQAEAVRAMLRSAPAPGRSTLIVAHRPNLADAAGPSFADLAEGEVAAFRPAPGERAGFQAVARVRPQDWAGIVAAAARN
jgi:phosphohistidine phosphatase SixA